MYVGVKNLEKDIEDGVHLVLAQAGEKWVNYQGTIFFGGGTVNEVNSK